MKKIKSCNEFTIYGLSSKDNVINQIEEELSIKDDFFDIKLILSEGISNAYYHGNKSDDLKEIKISYALDKKVLQIKIQDCGEGLKEVMVPKEIPFESILEDHGRGLYLINCYSDNVKFNKNVLTIERYLN